MGKHNAVAISAAAVTLALAGIVSFFAYSRPDALEHSLESYRDKAAEPAAGREQAAPSAPMADYSVPGVEHPFISSAVAGLVGAAVTFGAVVFLGWAVKSRRAARTKGTPVG